MKFTILSLLIVIASATLAVGEPASTVIAPSQFLGKSFEHCERQIGKPLSVEEPNEQNRGIGRFYRTTTPGVAKVLLLRAPSGGPDGPVSDTVSIVMYYFPKGTLKTWQEAFAAVGVPSDWATVKSNRADQVRLEGKDGFYIMWELAALSAKHPARFRDSNFDILTFTK